MNEERQKQMDKIEHQIGNCLVLYTMIREIPPNRFARGLAYFSNAGPTGCGSAYCIGGWVAVEPYFQKQGIVADDRGAPRFVASPLRFPYSVTLVAGDLFGDYTGSLFDAHQTRRTGVRDDDVDKEAALLRVENLLSILLSKQQRLSDGRSI